MDFKLIQRMLVITGIVLLVFLTLTSVLMFYPFKTVVFDPPVIQVLNPGHRVPLGGVVDLQIHYKKYTKATGLIIRTLIRKTQDENELIVLGSSTVVSNRGMGAGETLSHYVLSDNRFEIGKNCRVVYSIYYTIFGIRQTVVQYESEPFEIYDPAKEPKQ